MLRLRIIYPPGVPHAHRQMNGFDSERAVLLEVDFTGSHDGFGPRVRSTEDLCVQHGEDRLVAAGYGIYCWLSSNRLFFCTDTHP